jgi:nitrile hydratase beta subunit
VNGIHDMGGMQGLGRIEREAEEPIFHEPWEARMFAISEAMTYPPAINIDRWRYLAESVPAAAYLAQSYYERWYFVCASVLLEAGLVTLEELATSRAAPGFARRDDAMRDADVGSAIANNGKYARPREAPPRFAPQQRVIARNIHPAGHTRLPRYARGRSGIILRRHGAFVFPDSNARGDGESPQHLYTVAFEARELWGPDGAPRDKIHLDLWESYLDPA